MSRQDYNELRMQNVVKCNIERVYQQLNHNLGRLDDSLKSLQKHKSERQSEALSRESMAGHLIIQQLNSNLADLQKLHKEISKTLECQQYASKYEETRHTVTKKIKLFTQLTSQASYDSSVHPSDPPLDPRLQCQAGGLENTRTKLIGAKLLEDDVQDLSAVFNQLGSIVHEQQAQVDSIESHIEKAEENVKSGVKSLIKASTYAVVPVSAALLGTLLAGPIGAIVSGSVAVGLGSAAGGGTVGYAFARLLKKEKNRIAANDMQNLDNLDCPK